MAVSFLSSDRHLCRFLQACGNSWHGALYITCGECPRAISRRCRDLLCVFDANAQPIFIPVQDAELLWHTDIGKDDCLTVLSRPLFVELYKTWLFSHLQDPSACPLMGQYETPEPMNAFLPVACTHPLPQEPKSPLFPNL